MDRRPLEEDVVIEVAGVVEGVIALLELAPSFLLPASLVVLRELRRLFWSPFMVLEGEEGAKSQRGGGRRVVLTGAERRVTVAGGIDC